MSKGNTSDCFVKCNRQRNYFRQRKEKSPQETVDKDNYNTKNSNPIIAGWALETEVRKELTEKEQRGKGGDWI